MRDMKAAMQALNDIKGYAKGMMIKKKKPLNKILDEMDEVDGAVPGGSASKPDEDPDIYGDSRLPENLDGLDIEDDDVTVVMMSGRKAPKKFR